MSKRLTKTEKEVLRTVLYTVDTCMTRDLNEDLRESDFAYYGNYMNFTIAMNAKEYEAFKSLVDKI